MVSREAEHEHFPPLSFPIESNSICESSDMNNESNIVGSLHSTTETTIPETNCESVVINLNGDDTSSEKEPPTLVNEKVQQQKSHRDMDDVSFENDCENDDDDNVEGDDGDDDPHTEEVDVGDDELSSHHHNDGFNDDVVVYQEGEGIIDDSIYVSDDECDDDVCIDDPAFVSSRLAELEEEQEQLNSSLIALTSHFAQVQLRLKQIVDASPEDKERLLKELEEFAFRGIPDMRAPSTIDLELHDLTQSIVGEKSSSLKSSSKASSSLKGETATSVEERENDDGGSTSMALCTTSSSSSRLDRQREKQKELMAKLKNQLEDLEKYAYETGELNALPSSILLERQSVIIEQLKGKLSLNLDDLDQLSTPEDLRRKVDQALKELISPVIMKEQLVEQLKTQVSDLERFIHYLQQKDCCSKVRTSSTSSTTSNTSSSSNKCKNHHNHHHHHNHRNHHHRCTCNCPLHGNSQTSLQPYNEVIASERIRQANSSYNCSCGSESCSSVNGSNNHRRRDDDREEAIKMIKRVMTLLQMITFTQFGCNRTGLKRFERNTLKKTPRGSHWGDIRARLELAVDKILQLNKETFTNDSDYTSDSGDEISPANEKITLTVRKELCPALRDLIEHGLSTEEGKSSEVASSLLLVSHLLDWGCFSPRSSVLSSQPDSFSSSSSSSSTSASSLNRKLTAWDLILKYYHLKDGESFSLTPARRLSQSFNLHIVGGIPITPKQTLLTAVSDVIETHTPLKRSVDSHFKAFVSRALNEGKLTTWLRLIMKSRTLINTFYEPWSYAASTGFDDALKCLDKLTGVKFDLPTDLAVRQLTNITEAF